MTQADPVAKASDRHFVYFADPMCSWCYGFSPVIQKLRDHFEGRLPVRIVVGGLRAGNTEPMGSKDKDYIKDAWTRVGQASGQPFDFSFFERDGFIYDTEPACRAVVAMRNRHPEKALSFMGRISSEFYGNNRDVTSPGVLAEIALEAGDDSAAFIAEFEKPDTKNEAFRDFLFAQQSGVSGFPCLVVGNESDGYGLVTHGFRPIDGMIEALEEWLSTQPPRQS